MGGRKRSRDGGYDRIMNKIRKLEKKVKKRYKSDSESSESINSDGDAKHDDCIPIDGYEEIQPLDTVLPTASRSPTPVPPTNAAPPATEPLAPDAHPDDANPTTDTDLNSTCDVLDQEILSILGDDPSLEKSIGEDLHKDVASRWKHILLNGLSKDNRADLLKLYLPSENCSNMRAPKLNPEIKAALSELNNKKDAYSQSKQNQLTCCLAALGKVLNIILTKAANLPQDISRPISDASRLLCDYHHRESLSRRFAAMNSLNKETRDILKNTKIDDLLFGSNLPEQLKSSKAISKSGMEMRPPVAGPSGLKNKPIGTVALQPPAVRRNMTLNLRGAPRTAAAEPRVNPAPRRQPPAPHRHAPNSKPPQRYRTRRP